MQSPLTAVALGAAVDAALCVAKDQAGDVVADAASLPTADGVEAAGLALAHALRDDSRAASSAAIIKPTKRSSARRSQL
jgi:hypothetical protein